MKVIAALTSALSLASCALSFALPNLAAPLNIESLNRRDVANVTLTEHVKWDKYSLSVMGQRVFVFSGEFHPWRVPATELWRDIIQKAKASGFNTISIYLGWMLNEPSPGVLDFDHFRAVQPIIDLCTESGLFLVMRFGPYINAEVTAGGIPGWVVALEGELRTNATDYTAAWQGYVTHVAELTAKNQIDNGGPIIAVQTENEYYQRSGCSWPDQDCWAWTRAAYMQLLEDNLREHGVNLPIMHNDAQPRGNWVDGPGAVDMYAWDTYPQSFDCSNPYVWNPVPTTWAGNRKFVPDSPIWIAEAQQGAFDPWGSKGGYPACQVLTGPDFQRVFYKSMWAANVKMLNLYMLHGGTNWGGIATGVVYTSYDYGCAITENRLLSPKYDELKLQGLFLRSARDFFKTDWISENSTAVVTDGALLTTYLHNPDSGAGFNFVRHTNSSSFESTEFSLKVNSSIGALTVPRFSGKTTLRGRDHRLVPTDFHFGRNSTLLYSTASIMFADTIGDRDVLVVYADVNEQSGLELAVSSSSSSAPTVSGGMGVEWATAEAGYTTLNFTTVTRGLASIEVSPSLLVLVMDTVTAVSFWSPTISGDESAYLPHAYSLGTNDTVLISGPYLVRNASMEGVSLHVMGDLNATTPLIVFAPETVTSVTWNGADVEVTKNAWGALEGSVEFVPAEFTMPNLSNATWRYKDSLPEIQSDYDDSRWTLADHTTTTNPFPPHANNSGPWILYGNDYGFHTGNLLWRGRFNASNDSAPTAVELGVSGGQAFAASAWLNNASLGFMWSHNSTDSPTINSTFLFPEGSVQQGENIITVLQDHMGYYEAGNQQTPGGGQLDIKGPRGIQGYKLVGAGTRFDSWRVQGNLGGNVDFPDKTRGVLNEGGLRAERAGWHLPGFDDSDWKIASPVDGISAPGVGFYRTTFDLHLPDDVDAPLNIVFDDSKAFQRVQLYVNGYQFGKFVPANGPQFIFPIPRGIVDTNGTNTLALSLWGFSDAPEDLALAGVKISFDQVTRGSVAASVTNNPGWTERDSW